MARQASRARATTAAVSVLVNTGAPAWALSVLSSLSGRNRLHRASMSARRATASRSSPGGGLVVIGDDEAHDAVAAEGTEAVEELLHVVSFRAGFNWLGWVLAAP